MPAKTVSRAIRNCALKGLVATVVLFSIIWGIALLQENEAAVAALHRAALYSILAVASYTLYRVFIVAEKTRLGGRLYNLGTALGMIISGFGFWQVLAAFGEFRVWPGRFGLIIFSGIIGLAVSRLAAYRGERRDGLWWGIIGWLEDRPWAKFLIGVAVGLYLVYIRPYLTIDPKVLTVIEWVVVCILGFAILFRVWLGIRRTYISQEPEADWSKHRPSVERLTSFSHNYMIRMERQFINYGEETGLYVLLIALLHNNSINERDILEGVKLLIDFRDARIYRYELGPLRRRSIRRQVRWRKEMWKSTIYRINTLIKPARSAVPASNHTEMKQEDVALDELKQHLLETGERAGLFVRLALLLHRAGHRQEDIVYALKSLTDDRGRVSLKALETLLDSLKMTVA